MAFSQNGITSPIYNFMISIIIPIYNVKDYITDCITSILNQTYKDYEVILVDDCGRDDSVALAENMLKGGQVRFTTLRHEHNRGLSAARNTGFSVARGKYVLFVDSDDSLSFDCLEKLAAVADRTGADVTVGNINVVGNGSEIPLLSDNMPEMFSSRDEILASYMKGEWYMMAWNKLVRREFMNKNHIQFVEGLVHEDNPWSFEVACKAESMAFVMDKTYNYLVRENSLQTDKNFTRHYNAYKQILRIVADLIKDNNLEEKTHGWFERQKALFFGQTKMKGSKRQLRRMYSLIHNVLPAPSMRKCDIHYYLPESLGFMCYKKFFGYHLC